MNSPADTSPLACTLDSAAAYEFILSLCVVSDVALQATYEAGSEGTHTLPQKVPAGLLEDVASFSGESDLVWAHLLSLAYECPAPRDVPTFLRYLDGVDAGEIRLRLLGYYVRYFRRATPPETIAAAAAGDPEAQTTFLRTSYPDDPAWQAALRRLLPLDREETKARLLEIVRRWYDDVFRPQEQEILPILRRDQESKEALLNQGSPAQLFEAALPGVEYILEPGIRRILLIPSYVLRPLSHQFEHHDLKIIAYPVADESLTADPDAPSPALLRLARALGDERRLRVLKRLTQGDFTLQELANHFDAGNTTMLHHLVILRAAGLVRLSGGKAKRYRLRRETLTRARELLDRYLDDANEPTVADGDR